MIEPGALAAAMEGLLTTVACATCGAIEGQSLDSLSLVLGGGVAATAAVAGANVDRDAVSWTALEPGIWPDRRLHAEGIEHHHWGDAGVVDRGAWRGGPTPTILDAVDHRVVRISRQLQKWAESIVGKDESGTTAAAGKA